MPAKEKKNTKILSGTSGVYEEVLFPADECLIEKNKAFWDILREKPGYLELCEEIQFHPWGLVSPAWSVNNRERFKEISKTARHLFGIETIVDPRKEADELYPDILHITGLAPIIVKAIAKREGINFDNEKSRFLRDGKFLTLEIDITEKDAQIFTEMKTYLEYFRQYADKKGKDHYTAQRESCKVWRKRRSRVPFSVIAGNFGITIDLAKKRFYRAFELIMGEPYRKDLFERMPINKIYLKKTCDNCPDKECMKNFKLGKEWIPCPDVMLYIAQDKVNRHDGLQADYGLLYSEDPTD